MGHHEPCGSPVRSGPGSRTKRTASVVLAAGLLLAGCTSAGGIPQNARSGRVAIGSSSSGQPVEAGALLTDPAAYDGRHVTTTGTVRLLSPYLLALSPSAGATAPSPGVAASSPAVPSRTGASPTSPPAETRGGPVRPLGPDELLVVYGLPEGPPGGGLITVTGTFHRSFDASVVVRQIDITLNRSVIDVARLESRPPVLISDTVGKAGPS